MPSAAVSPPPSAALPVPTGRPWKDGTDDPAPGRRHTCRPARRGFTARRGTCRRNRTAHPLPRRPTPAGRSCRTCLVRADGRTVAACVTPAMPGLTVDTAGESVRNLRRDAVALIASALPPHALADSAHSELAEACRSLGIPADPQAGDPTRGRDESHPYVHLDRDLCIACGRCVRMCADVQGTFALTLTGRGADTVVAPGTGGPWAAPTACPAAVASTPVRRGRSPSPGPVRASPRGRLPMTACGPPAATAESAAPSTSSSARTVSPLCSPPGTGPSTGATPASRAASRTDTSAPPNV